eukprot:763552-Hanusia_phi.AAC.4
MSKGTTTSLLCSPVSCNRIDRGSSRAEHGDQISTCSMFKRQDTGLPLEVEGHLASAVSIGSHRSLFLHGPPSLLHAARQHSSK